MPGFGGRRRWSGMGVRGVPAAVSTLVWGPSLEEWCLEIFRVPVEA